MMTLDKCPVDRCGRVTTIAAPGAVSQRLMAMGFLPGEAVRVVRVAPLGDPITVALGDWRVSLRRSEASLVEVESPGDEPFR